MYQNGFVKASACIAAVFALALAACGDSGGGGGADSPPATGLSGTFERTQDADGGSTPAVYQITVEGKAAKDGVCYIKFGPNDGNGSFQAGQTNGDIAVLILARLNMISEFTTYFTGAVNPYNVITMTAKHNGTDANFDAADLIIRFD
jgi:hypothetical protein